MQTFAAVPINSAGQRSEQSYTTDARSRTDHLDVDFVFVDEHNRHKRLKGE